MNTIPFPTPQLERYEILYNPLTHEVDIPLIPDDAFTAMVILGVFIDMLLEEGTLDMVGLDTTITGVKLAQREDEN